LIYNPFEWNDENESSAAAMDPDLHYFSDPKFSNLNNCEYYTEDSLNSLLQNADNLLTSSISMYHHNIRSLPKHFTEMKFLLDQLNIKPLFIGISETWLNENNKDLFCLEGYQNPYQSYRSKQKGGGVLMYVKENINFKARTDLNFSNDLCESVFIEIGKEEMRTTKNIIIGLMYRIPNTNTISFNDELKLILNTLNQENKFIYMMGDYNIDLLKSEEHAETSNFIDILYSNYMVPLITRPTRITQCTATLIDNIYTNNFTDGHNLTQGLLFSDISDHLPIFHINCESSSNNKQVEYIWKRTFSNNAINGFKNACSLTNWDTITQTENTQGAYTKFQDMIQNLYNNYFPIKKLKVNIYNSRYPWISPAINNSIKIKNKLYIKQLKKKNDYLTIEYKTYKNKLNKILRQAERKHYHDLLQKHRTDLKSSWKVIKQVINKKQCRKINTKFIHNNTAITKPKSITEKFNDFFVNIGPTLANKIPKSNITPQRYLNTRVTESIFLNPVEISEVNKIITNLKNSSPGWDGIGARIVKEVKSYLMTPLLHIFNRSFYTGVFPKEMKLANVVPIFKSGDDSIFTNYRPVSVLPIFSKILERLMYNRLIDFINKHNLLYEYQFGFRKKYSTNMALIALVDRVSSALDNGKNVIGLFLDFSKAFDTVDHHILLLKLQNYGIRGTAHDWLKHYLSDREQYVTYNGVKSNPARIKCGVPQGSILGPLLFLLYINDLSFVTKFSFPLLFADDSNLFFEGENISDIANNVNTDLDNIVEWLYANKLSLNIKKTHYIIFSRNKAEPSDVDIKIKGSPIYRVYSTKFLGVFIDSKLNWKAHIDYIATKLSKCIGILNKAKSNLPTSALVNLYYTFAYPYFIYCIHVWGNTCVTYIDKLIKIQKKLIRIVTRSSYLAPTALLFQNNKLLRIPDIYKYMTGIFMYKYASQDLPHVFNNMFVLNQTTHSHYTRQHLHYSLPLYRTSIFKKSVRYQGVLIWNTLSQPIKDAHSVQAFKYLMKVKLLS
jgi:hypothetical protein